MDPKAPTGSNSIAPQPISRRDMLLQSAAAAGAALWLGTAVGEDRPARDAKPPKPNRRPNRIAVSTYSYWRFRKDSRLPIETCIDLAAETGFDGVEILHIQMEDESNAYLQRLKQRAFRNGLDLCGFSTHQGFVSPDKEVRRRNIDHTRRCIELAYRLGIPTIRVNTGRWGRSRTSTS